MPPNPESVSRAGTEISVGSIYGPLDDEDEEEKDADSELSDFDEELLNDTPPLELELLEDEEEDAEDEDDPPSSGISGRIKSLSCRFST